MPFLNSENLRYMLQSTVLPKSTVGLRKGREKKIHNFYPWVQREEVEWVEGEPEAGDLVRLCDHEGGFLGIGTYNPTSRFPVRLLTTQEEPVDTAYFLKRFEEARLLRERLIHETDSYRLIFGEADSLPGLIIDRYADYAVVQVRTLGMERLKPIWLPALLECLKPAGVMERSEMEARREEGLPPQTGVLYGDVPDEISIMESGFQFLVPTRTGSKTGFYLDQRDNRRQLAREVQPDERILDLFCYTGAFSIYAARVGAAALGIDLSPDAVALASRHADINGLQARFECANAFEWLENAEAEREPFDWILLDPPAIAKARNQRNSLKWAIWKLIYGSLPLLKPGGRLLVCNCSYQFSLQEMTETTRLAASDRRCKIYLDDHSFQAPDHPHLLQFPESLYLKCLWLRTG